MIIFINNFKTITMQERNLTELLQHSQKPFSLMQVKNDMTDLALKNAKDLSTKELSDYLRIPTADELVIMRQWAVDYKRANPSFSKRQIRKAVQQNFNIKIYR